MNSSGTYIEYWYYANNIGPVYINVTSPAAQATTLALVSYPGESGSISQTTPLVTLYDAITAQAGTVGTMTFAEWGPLFCRRDEPCGPYRPRCLPVSIRI